MVIKSISREFLHKMWENVSGAYAPKQEPLKLAVIASDFMLELDSKPKLV
jgi:hypothetical protein